MSDDELLQRRHARQEIDYFLMQHSLHYFRNNQPEQFASDARTLQHYLHAIHGDNQAKIIAETKSIADQIAEYDLSPGAPNNGHHEQAAEAIRTVATEVEKVKCPWAELYPLFRSHRILRALAQSLWNHNRQYAREWSVSIDTVAEEVWGELSPSRSTIRSSVSRLASWLEERGVIVDISVNYSTGRGFINCKMIRVDEALVKQSCD